MHDLAFAPSLWSDALDDLAVEVSRERMRRGHSLSDLQRAMGWSRSRRNQFSKWERGVFSDFGIVAASKVAAYYKIPMRLVCGEEAREPAPRSLRQISPPSLLPTIGCLTKRVAA